MDENNPADSELAKMITAHLTQIWHLADSVHPEWDGLNMTLYRQEDSTEAKINIDYMIKKEKGNESS